MQYLIRYSEIFLKSDYVRKRWEKKLLENIRKFGISFKFKIDRGRIWIFTDERVDDKLKRVFGIVSFSPCLHCKLDELDDFILSFCEGRLNVKTFAVRVKRVGRHEFTSKDVERRLGSMILRKFPNLKVDLKNPDKVIYVEIRDEDCYVFDEVVKGVGGIPLGVEGKVVSLLSGGIDSSVATWLMMKRGCKVIPIHFDIRPFGESSVRKVVDFLRLYDPEIEVKVVEHGSFLEEVLDFLRRKRLESYTCVICKRRMLRVAESIAREEGAKGIVTGDSLGQVASQTLDNIMVIDEVCKLPVFRPLIGFDKVEIEEIARRIGTSSTPVKCRAVPKRPTTKANLERILEIEKDLSVY